MWDTCKITFFSLPTFSIGFRLTAYHLICLYPIRWSTTCKILDHKQSISISINISLIWLWILHTIMPYPFLFRVLFPLGIFPGSPVIRSFPCSCYFSRWLFPFHRLHIPGFSRQTYNKNQFLNSLSPSLFIHWWSYCSWENNAIVFADAFSISCNLAESSVKLSQPRSSVHITKFITPPIQTCQGLHLLDSLVLRSLNFDFTLF